jgi:hypothetical protein
MFWDRLSVPSSRVKETTEKFSSRTEGPTGCPETSPVTTNWHCITSQKSEDLKYTIREA